MTLKTRQFLPLMLSVSLAIGIIIGNLFNKDASKSNNKIEQIIDIVKENYVDTINAKQLSDIAIENMLQSLDPHSVYIPASSFAEANETLEGNFEGIGVQFRIEKDTIYVMNTIPKGPSEKAGVMAGDRIMKIEGKNVTNIHIKNEDVIKKLKGQKGTIVKISIKRLGISKLLDFSLTRDVIPTHSLDASYMANNEIAYVRMSSFSADTYNELIEALNKLEEKGFKKLILDLRENEGGYLQTAIDIADEFLSNGKMIVYTLGQSRNRKDAIATSKGKYENIPIVVLIDENSASASEILAAAIQDNDRGMVIGRRSFGKGLVQEQIKLTDGSAIRLTVSRYYTPTGRCIQKPYTEGSEKYYIEQYSRMLNVENEDPDSIKFPDSLKYKTPKGKIVYGGGGIMPDIYIKLKKDSKYIYLNTASAKGLLYRFSFEYTDKNRETLKKYKNSDDFNKEFVVSDELLNNFVNYLDQNGIKKDIVSINATKQTMKIRLKAYIARNLFDDEAFLKIYNPDDNTFTKAIEVLDKIK